MASAGLEVGCAVAGWSAPKVVDAAALIVRDARSAEVMATGLVHVRSWQAAYQGPFPQEYLDGLDPMQRGKGWQRSLERERQQGEAVLVTDLDGSPASSRRPPKSRKKLASTTRAAA